MISVRGLRVRAGSTVLVDDVCLDVAAGEAVTLFGPSGAGKTTIAAAIAGVRRPGVVVDGQIRLSGARVGYLPQHAAATLNPARRIGAALGEYAGIHARPGGHRLGRGARRVLVAQALSAAAFDIDGADLGRLLRRFPVEFSGGERARLALAQVLASDPQVLIVDEPTVGLDPPARAKLLDSLDLLRRNGTAVVLVTHDRVAVRRLGGRVLRVERGRVRSGGLPAPGPDGPAPSRPVPQRPVLCLRDISVTRRNTPILRNVDLELGAGELLAMVGVSGAGKSTIARVLAGLDAPGAGRVELDGAPLPVLRKRSRADIAAVQYVWQESAGSFDPRRTVLDQVAATALRLRGHTRTEAYATAVTVLAELEIDVEQARRYPPNLSGGQLQRAALARALTAEPRALICDEVTTALDHRLAQRILAVVEDRCHGRGTAVLWISHDIRTAVHRADRLAVVDSGRITEQGTAQQLVNDPATSALRLLLHADDLDRD